LVEQKRWRLAISRQCYQASWLFWWQTLP